MRLFPSLFVVAAAVLCAGLGGRGATAPTAGQPSTWYRCATGATLEVMGTASRCTFSPVVVLEPLMECARGWWVVVDGTAGADACSNGTQTVSRACAAGVTLVVLPKREDRCERVAARAAEPPQTAGQA
jgi:hypothetical protein